ncbi:uncharacterized protein LOC142157993 isoform X3 [Mixophyes fleayi]|uniref:uncharacterized protein LOC142157993 isoform X3 n=1 Tax=Mixophyes fleayi TaxID=3061075 RepID=UPI003F4D734B
MKNLLWLLSVVSLVQCVSSQVSFTQSGPGTVKPSQTLELTCKVTGASLTDSSKIWAVHWIRQAPGKGLEWLGRIRYDELKNFAQSIEGRLTLSRDTNKGEVYFKLTGVRPEETGTYYAARESLHCDYFDIWGPGTTVTVTSDDKSDGILLPLIPCCEMVKNNPTLTIGCLLKDAIPIDIKKITWKDVDNSKAKQLPPINTSVIRAVSSFLTISSTDWDKNKYTCSVGDNKKELNEGCKRTTVTVTHPHTEVLLATCEDNSQLSIVPVTCLVSDFKPNEASVLWLKNGLRHDATNSGFKAWKGEDGLFSGKSTLNISRESWIKEDRYTCMVTLKGQTSMHNISKCSACSDSFMTPIVDLQLPCNEDLLYDNGTITCSILGSNLDASQIFLKLDGKTAEIDTTGNENNRTVTYKVATKVWGSTDKVSCGVKQPCYKQDLVKEIHVDNKDIKAISPSVQILASCDSNIAASSVALLCIISDFWPQDASVTWLKNEKAFDNNATLLIPMKDRTGKYSGKSILNITRESWNNEDIYTCQVTHHKKTFNHNISKSRVPDGDILKPSFKDLFLYKNATVSCRTNVDSANIQVIRNGVAIQKNSKQVQIKLHNITWTQMTAEVTLEEWNTTSNLSCTVQPPQGALQKQLSIKRTHEPGEIKAPAVYLLPPAHESVILEDALTLVCLVKDYYPEDLFVTWSINDSLSQQDVTDSSSVNCNSNTKRCSITSQLSILKSEWLKGTRYSCLVAHISSDEFTRRNISVVLNKSDSLVVPEYEIVKPSFKDLFLYKNATVSCRTNVDSVKIQLTMNGIRNQKKSKQVQIKLNNMTWTQITTEVTLEKWNTTSNLSCTVQPPQGALSKKLSIKRTHEPGEIKAPAVYLLPPAQESVILKDALTLVCLVKDYYPEDLFVTWSINDSLSEQDVTDSSSVNCNSNTKRCSITSQLSILKSEWLKGTRYSCLVAHISSDEFTRRNISVVLNKSEDSLVDPEYVIVKPSFKELFLSKTATVKCRTNVVSNGINWLVNGTGMHTSWQRHNEQILHKNVTWVQSTIQIPLEEWKNISALSCKLNNSQELQLKTELIY